MHGHFSWCAGYAELVGHWIFPTFTAFSVEGALLIFLFGKHCRGENGKRSDMFRHCLQNRHARIATGRKMFDAVLIQNWLKDIYQSIPRIV
jgi:hypothetical protein